MSQTAGLSRLGGKSSDGIDDLLAAAEATGVSHVVTQGHASMNGLRKGGWVKTEEDPLEVLEGTKAINHQP